VQICSTPFVPLGRTQATALGYADLPIAVVAHPFASHSRDKLRKLADECTASVLKLIREAQPAAESVTKAAARIATIDVEDDADAVNRLFRERRWTDGFPVVAPTRERVQRMLRCTPRDARDVVAVIPPGFGPATVELIAINAVMAGCEPEYMPVLIAAVEAAADPKFNLQAIQATTNSAGVWLIVNGPVAKRLGMNAGINCLGNGNWANATLGRALRLALQNAGGALPGDMDQATQGQPGKYSFCCAENEDASPWEPLHVERGYTAVQSTVTVVGASGTLNMNMHSKDDELLRSIADTMAHPSSNDYWFGGAPWIILSPEHADVLKSLGLRKEDVRRELWERSKMPANRFSARERVRIQSVRRDELGEIALDSLIPISPKVEGIGIIVAGGPGTHSVYVPSFGAKNAVTREVIWAG